MEIKKINGEECLVIQARPVKRKEHRCGICGRKCSCYDKGYEHRRWRALDFGGMKVFLEADTERVFCPEHGVVTAAVPWARHASRFTRDFEDQTAWLATRTSRVVVSRLMRIAWNTVGPISQRVYEELRTRQPNPLDGLTCIGIDETSYKKGHKYITVVVNHENGALIWAADGYGKEVLEQFFELLNVKQRSSIQCVTADGARWIADCIEKYCPNAERCIDPFHVVSWATEALDEVRRGVWREAFRKEKKSEKAKLDKPDGPKDLPGSESGKKKLLKSKN